VAAEEEAQARVRRLQEEHQAGLGREAEACGLHLLAAQAGPVDARRTQGVEAEEGERVHGRSKQAVEEGQARARSFRQAFAGSKVWAWARRAVCLQESSRSVTACSTARSTEAHRETTLVVSRRANRRSSS
jgi:hypothetical protein